MLVWVWGCREYWQLVGWSVGGAGGHCAVQSGLAHAALKLVKVWVLEMMSLSIGNLLWGLGLGGGNLGVLVHKYIVVGCMLR